MAKQQQSHPIADQFSDDEMSQIQRHGAAQMGDPSFSDEVEKHLNALEKNREASAPKMKAAMTGGDESDLGPTAMDQAKVKQTQALQQQATTQGAQQAQQAQAADQPLQPPSAPGGAAGTSQPYRAQAGPQPAPPVTPPQPASPVGPPPAAPDEGGEED